jgi:hypothetical protein
MRNLILTQKSRYTSTKVQILVQILTQKSRFTSTKVQILVQILTQKSADAEALAGGAASTRTIC